MRSHRTAVMPSGVEGSGRGAGATGEVAGAASRPDSSTTVGMTAVSVVRLHRAELLQHPVHRGGERRASADGRHARRRVERAVGRATARRRLQRADGDRSWCHVSERRASPRPRPGGEQPRAAADAHERAHRSADAAAAHAAGIRSVAMRRRGAHRFSEAPHRGGAADPGRKRRASARNACRRLAPSWRRWQSNFIQRLT